MLHANEIKQILFELGADLCGIASVDRFTEAPEGFHPHDVLPSCQSVIVIAKKMPAGTLHSKSAIPYTIARNLIAQELDAIAVKFCGMVEENGILAVPAGTLGPCRQDPKTGRTRAAVSAKHSAVAAGLGWLGKNTLLITPEYGNMVWLTVILANARLEPDKIPDGNPCNDRCRLCIDNCPVQALGNPEMNQGACFAHAFGDDYGNGNWIFKCYACRSICPYCLGSKNRL